MPPLRLGSVGGYRISPELGDSLDVTLVCDLVKPSPVTKKVTNDGMRRSPTDPAASLGARRLGSPSRSFRPRRLLHRVLWKPQHDPKDMADAVSILIA